MFGRHSPYRSARAGGPGAWGPCHGLGTAGGKNRPRCCCETGRIDSSESQSRGPAYESPVLPSGFRWLRRKNRTPESVPHSIIPWCWRHPCRAGDSSPSLSFPSRPDRIWRFARFAAIGVRDGDCRTVWGRSGAVTTRFRPVSRDSDHRRGTVCPRLSPFGWSFLESQIDHPRRPVSALLWLPMRLERSGRHRSQGRRE